MQVIEQNEGVKIKYKVQGTQIVFDDKLTIDLEMEQEDIQKIIDVSLDKENNLIKGVGTWYAANIVVPPCEYKQYEESNIAAPPVNMDRVVLILWALEGGMM